MYKILIDSCGELPQELKEDGHFSNVALVLEVDGQQIVDDETFDQADFLSRVAKSPNAPKSACPSPDAYMQKMEGDADHIYIVTLSAKLSGSYNRDVYKRQLYLRLHPEMLYTSGRRGAGGHRDSGCAGSAIAGAAGERDSDGICGYGDQLSAPGISG